MARRRGRGRSRGKSSTVRTPFSPPFGMKGMHGGRRKRGGGKGRY